MDSNRENFEHYIYGPSINLKFHYKSIQLIDSHYIDLFNKGYCIDSFIIKQQKKILIS